MELKLISSPSSKTILELLIVPYGIETNQDFWVQLGFRILLIVPYGIETCNAAGSGTQWMLLIVPYGIETTMPMRDAVPVGLLIVPYGIETWDNISLRFTAQAFNRTLWN